MSLEPSKVEAGGILLGAGLGETLIALVCAYVEGDSQIPE